MLLEMFALCTLCTLFWTSIQTWTNTYSIVFVWVYVNRCRMYGTRVLHVCTFWDDFYLSPPHFSIALLLVICVWLSPIKRLAFPIQTVNLLDTSSFYNLPLLTNTTPQLRFNNCCFFALFVIFVSIVVMVVCIQTNSNWYSSLSVFLRMCVCIVPLHPCCPNVEDIRGDKCVTFVLL